MDTADVVIIGGGAVGTSIAYHLGQRGIGRGVLLLERATLGSGSTGRSAGGIRSQFSTEVNIRFSLESVAFWRSFEERLGLPIDYHEIGYLFLAQSREQQMQFERNVALQHQFGVASRVVDPEEMTRLVPGLFTADLVAGAYCPTDALAGPNEATQAFARRAREAGVRIREGVEVTAIHVRGSRAQAVETTDGRIETRVVINAAGPWAAVVGQMVGVDVPVKPYRRELFVSEPFQEIPEIPLVIDLASGWYVRREGPGVLMSGAKDSHSSFDTHVDWAGRHSPAAGSRPRSFRRQGLGWSLRCQPGRPRDPGSSARGSRLLLRQRLFWSRLPAQSGHRQGDGGADRRWPRERAGHRAAEHHSLQQRRPLAGAADRPLRHIRGLRRTTCGRREQRGAAQHIQTVWSGARAV